METIIFIFTEIIYYLFFSFIITKFKSSYLANSCILLFLFSMLISLPSLISINAIKNRKKYFIVSTILIISSSLLIFIFRKFTKNGIINFTFYLYTTLFMFIPFFSLFTLSIHKLSIPRKKKKQLVTLIVSKKLLIILFTFVFSYFLKLKDLIILIGILVFITNIISPFVSNFLLEYQD